MKDKGRYRLVILTSVCLVRFCSGAIWASAGPLLPLLISAYGISSGTAGWFASIAPLTIAIVAMPIGLIGARYSLKKTFAVGAILQAGGLLAPVCGGYVPLLLTRICYAIGSSITFPLVPAIASEWFSAQELPVINGIAMGVTCLGNTMAYVATVPLALAFSWRAPITIYGGLALTMAVAWIIVGKERRKEKSGEAVIQPELEKSQPELTLRQALTQRSTIILALATMGSWSLGTSLGAWLPTYYHQVFNMPLEKASSITAIITITGIGSCIVGGILPLRIGRRKPFLIIPGIFMGISALSAVLFNNMIVIYISVACFGILSNLYGPSLFTIPFELHKASPRITAMVTFAMTVGGNFGNFLLPLIVGYLADITNSYLPGFIISAVVSLALLMAGLLLPETGPLFRTKKPSEETQLNSL